MSPTHVPNNNLLMFTLPPLPYEDKIYIDVIDAKGNFVTVEKFIKVDDSM